MPGKKLNILQTKSLRAFLVFKNTPSLITVTKNLQFIAVSLHPKFPYLPYCLCVNRAQTLYLRGFRINRRK